MTTENIQAWLAEETREERLEMEKYYKVLDIIQSMLQRGVDSCVVFMA